MIKTRKLIAALNMVAERIFSEYITIKTREEVVSDNEYKVAFDKFTYPIHEVLKVVDALTKSVVDFDIFPTFVSLPNFGRKYIVEYRYLPNFVGDINDIIVLPTFVTERVLCLGVVSDILLSRNIFDESKVWNDKFVEAVKLIKVKIRERKF